MKDYVANLRKMIGHEPVILVGTNIIVLNDKDELLLQKRSDLNCWCLPGGNMEPGEKIEDTAKRELLEETGLIASSVSLLDVLSGPEYFFEYPNGDKVHSVICLFKADDVAGNLKMNESECIDLRYFSLNALPEIDYLPVHIVKGHFKDIIK